LGQLVAISISGSRVARFLTKLSQERGKPTQNAFVENLNGKFRNECLNQHWFRSLDEASYLIDQWRYHYNYERPHSSLNYVPPALYQKQAA